MATDKIEGTSYSDRIYAGSGSQTVEGGNDWDYIVSYGDGGEPDPAQTDGADGRVNPAIAEGSADDVFTGGAGGDTFEFRALLNAKTEVATQHTGSSGQVNWRGVAGENDNVHDHWVEGFGNDTITDYTKAEGDRIVIRGHTVEVASITYGEDEDGTFSLISVRSQQGDGGAGGANTETGAHDEDSLGTIKVYGDRVEADDIQVKAANVFDGIDQLHHIDAVYGDAEGGVTQVVFSNTDGDSYNGIANYQVDVVHAGLGSQTINAGGGRDTIYSYSDGGEPDPAQTEGDAGRVNPPVAPELSNDILSGGQRGDTFVFNFLLNAREDIIEEHTRSDGSINWRGVAGENDNPHDHWVEGIGNDTILDFSNQDGDRIVLRGHTVQIAGIEYGEDEGGDYSLISVRSQQGDGANGGANTATGAHDEDGLGTIKVYGDKVTEENITVQAAGVYDGIDKLEDITAFDPMQGPESPAEASTDLLAEEAEEAEETVGEPDVQVFEGSTHSEVFRAGSGRQVVDGGNGSDYIISYGDGGEPDPAQTNGADGRVNPAIAEGSADDVFTGGAGRDTFEFRALLNAKDDIQADHTWSSGQVNWRGVAGENDNVHDHWVEGFGNDTITDYTKADGDRIVIRGHTVEVANITYGEDEDGSYSLIAVRSQQGDGGAGGANTATGAHDEDSLGTIKVYGDRVEADDIQVKAANIFDGIDQLDGVDDLADYNGGTQWIVSAEAGEVVTSADTVKTVDKVFLGAGAQQANAGAGDDYITVYSDAGEPNPAQTGGEGEGRVTPAVEGSVDDTVRGGQGRDTFEFNFLLNATNEVKAQHTWDSGQVNWRGVAGENDNPHDHWVEGIGNDTILDFSNQDGDRIVLRGHTVQIAGIEYGEDEGGDYSLISVRSQQGDGANGGANTETGAHDEDQLGTIKVYGDKVTIEDIEVQAAGVFDGVDELHIFEPEEEASTAEPQESPDLFEGSTHSEVFRAGSGRQVVDGGNGSDYIISYGDGGEPDPAQTDGADGRVNPAIAEGSADDVFTGGAGRDTFEFRALLNAKDDIRADHTWSSGQVNWRGVAGENDNVHDHWVEGFGNDTITDYTKADGDRIVIRGHTVEVAGITYGEDEDGSYSLIAVRSQQGDGGAGGANTASGAHDEDSLGTIKVYGDRVEADDIQVKAANIFDGIDQLDGVDDLADYNGGTQWVVSAEAGEVVTSSDTVKTVDKVFLGAGAQNADAGAGDDYITVYSDAGEPNPAQTGGEGEGRATPAVEGSVDDTVRGGQGRDTFEFNFLLNATNEVKAQHTWDSGQVNWRGVAGENDNPHDHWVEGIGNDTILDFSNQDGDRIVLRGHTVQIAGIEYGEDDGGDYSLISVRSQQGDGANGGANTATGAHDEDQLGTIKVYGDKVTIEDIKVQAAGVFDGVDELHIFEPAAPEVTPSTFEPAPLSVFTPATFDVAPAVQELTGSSSSETLKAGSGQQVVNGGDGWDYIVSFGDGGEPDPAQTEDGVGRVNGAVIPVIPGSADDVFTGGSGGDTFEFRALLNAKDDIQADHTWSSGQVNWRGVAGENDNVHDHWVEGFGNDTITDYSKDERDRIVIRGHTVEVAGITYGEDEDGSYSLIAVRSQQGDGGAGGFNTATGAHDEDSLGTIKVYGDRVEADDIEVKAANIFDGIDQLDGVDDLADYNGGSQSFLVTEDSMFATSSDTVKTTDRVYIGTGVQEVGAGAGYDYIVSYSDSGEPNPARTGGDGEGRVTPLVAAGAADDLIRGGQGRDEFTFNFLLNATAAVIARHTRSDGSINWHRVAQENDAVHDHWVEGIGNDTILDYSDQDDDRIVLRGHTVEIAGITYGEDEGGDYSLISVRSQQGDGGGAHDEDALGTIKVYGDRVEADDIQVKTSWVYDGIDKYEEMEGPADGGELITGDNSSETIFGTDGSDTIHAYGGNDTVDAGDGDDFVFGSWGSDQLFGGDGNDWLEGGSGNDLMNGEAGNDILVADSGRDTMLGGADADTFVLATGSRGGSILDWEDGLDLIDFTRNDHVEAFEDLTITQVSDGYIRLSYLDGDESEVSFDVTGSGEFDLGETDFLL